MNVKERIKAGIESLPEDPAYDEILREPAMARMVERGMADSRQERVIANEEMGRRVQQWRK